MVVKMSTNVNIPTIVVNIPIRFDFVHPDNEIIAVNENNPTIKVVIPIMRAIKKSSATTFLIYPPGVVIIDI